MWQRLRNLSGYSKKETKEDVHKDKINAFKKCKSNRIWNFEPCKINCVRECVMHQFLKFPAQNKNWRNNKRPICYVFMRLTEFIYEICFCRVGKAPITYRNSLSLRHIPHLSLFVRWTLRGFEYEPNVNTNN